MSGRAQALAWELGWVQAREPVLVSESVQAQVQVRELGLAREPGRVLGPVRVQALERELGWARQGPVAAWAWERPPADSCSRRHLGSGQGLAGKGYVAWMDSFWTG